MNHVAQEAAEAGTSTAAAGKKKPEFITVTMSDGEKRDFIVNAKTGQPKFMLKDYFLNEDGSFNFARFDFLNGEVRVIRPPDSLVGQFVGHGIMQKYGDELAGQKNEDGSPLDVEDVILVIDNLNDNIQKGEWSQRKEGDGMGGTSTLIKALMAYSNQTVEKVKAFLKDKDAKFKTALRHNDQRPNAAGDTVASIVKKLEAEKAAKAAKVDTSGALDELDSMGGEAASA